jgi:transposase-like protein
LNRETFRALQDKGSAFLFYGDYMAKYDEWLQDEKLIILQGWARDGLSEEQIAHNMGIAPPTLREWKKKFSTISTALKKGKEVADFEVENATFKNACGHTVEEKTIERRFNKESGEYELVVTKIQERYIPPNPTSQIFWLKNRKPEIWREKQIEQPDTTAIDKLDGILQGFEEIAKNDTTITQAE